MTIQGLLQFLSLLNHLRRGRQAQAENEFPPYAQQASEIQRRIQQQGVELQRRSTPQPWQPRSGVPNLFELGRRIREWRQTPPWGRQRTFQDVIDQFQADTAYDAGTGPEAMWGASAFQPSTRRDMWEATTQWANRPFSINPWHGGIEDPAMSQGVADLSAIGRKEAGLPQINQGSPWLQAQYAKIQEQQSPKSKGAGQQEYDFSDAWEPLTTRRAAYGPDSWTPYYGQDDDKDKISFL